MMIGLILMTVFAIASVAGYLSVKNAQWVDDDKMEL